MAQVLKTDQPLFLTVVLMAAFGMVMVYSSSSLNMTSSQDRQAKLDLLTDEFEVGSAIDRDAEGVITRVITWAIREQDQIPDPLDQLD